MNIFRTPQLKIAKEKHGLIVDFLDGLRADHRDGKYNEWGRPVKDEFVLLFCERYGYCKYEYKENKFIRILTEKGAEVLIYMDYDSYLVAKWWKKFWERIPIPISILAIIVSLFAIYHEKDNSFKDEGESRVKQLEVKSEQLQSEINYLKEQAKQNKNATVFYIDTSKMKSFKPQ